MRTLFCILALALSATAAPPFKRVVILKVDGLNADLLTQTMQRTNPATGKSMLPWFTHIFADNGTVFDNFYSRGISLSAPSWSMLDTGRHTIIRGNVEYDRYTGYVYDYLNFFPFYIGYARKQQEDMPGVEVLDRAGIPLLIDRFAYEQELQSFQLFQRGVRWSTLKAVLKRRLRSELLSPVESGYPEPLAALLNQQTESELKAASADGEVLYLDFYSGDIDHEGHATNQVAALTDTLEHLDRLAARIWTAIQASPLADETLFVAVSDHGMNNRPDVSSESFSLPDFFNSPAGGGQHVVTNRHQLSNYKILGLDPLVQRVISPSTASSYLSGQADRYPTVWLDLDGNERAAVHLRNNDLNRFHILLQQLARKELPEPTRKAATQFLQSIVARHREGWSRTVSEMEAELGALQGAIDRDKAIDKVTSHRVDAEWKRTGRDKDWRRRLRVIAARQREMADYGQFVKDLKTRLAFETRRAGIERYIPPMQLGDNNSPDDIQNYVVGPSPDGLVLKSDGTLDEERSFRHVNYLSLLMSQQVRNNPQPALTNQPVDFVAMRLPDAGEDHAYWLSMTAEAQLTIRTDAANRIQVRPHGAWRAGLPLHLFEDPNLSLPAGVDRAQWLSDWHTESEWMEATHRCLYSNGVIGITEELSPVEENVPGTPGMDPLLLRYERRRRALVQADFHLFAADGWNFNARDFNPGGNHGSFFRISTHSVWMMAGRGVPKQVVTHPVDSLNFASTVLNLIGKPVPMPDRVVSIVH